VITDHFATPALLFIMWCCDFFSFLPKLSLQTCQIRSLMKCTGVESVEARARLCSVTDDKLLLPSTDTVTVDRRGFYCACQATWNSLSPHLTDMSVLLFSFRNCWRHCCFIDIHEHYCLSDVVSLWHVCDVSQLICAFSLCLTIIIITKQVWKY